MLTPQMKNTKTIDMAISLNNKSNTPLSHNMSKNTSMNNSFLSDNDQ